MARSYANIVTAIWTDRAFCERSAGAQRTYFMLLTQSDISAAGTLALTVRRWSTTLPEDERPRLVDWLDELIDHGYIVIDQDTEELLVRTFIRWDNSYTNPRRLPAIEAAAKTVRSSILRRSLAAELAKLDLPVWLPDSHTVSHTDSQSDSQQEMAIETSPEWLPDSHRSRPGPGPTPGPQPTSIRSAKPSAPDRFDEFWDVYPKRVAKLAAKRRWDTLVKRGTDQGAIISGAKLYAAEVRGTDPQFVKQPDGWLNAGRWEDEPARPAQPVRPLGWESG